MKKTICKIVIAGDGGTGKSTFITTKKGQQFTYSSKITIGVDYACFPVQIEACNHEEMMFLIYDLGGQKRFHFMHSSYIIGSKAAMIFYDLTRPKTFDNITYWHAILCKENPFMPILIGGTKKDLVQPADIRNFNSRWRELKELLPNKHLIIDHIFISSKAYEGIDIAFQKIGEALINRPNIMMEQQKYIQTIKH